MGTQSTWDTTPRSPSTSSSKTLTKPTPSITKLSTISASEPSNLPPQHTVTSTTSSPPPCPVSLHASDSLVSLTPISVNSLSTWSHSHVSTFSCPVLPHLPAVDLNNTVPLLFLNSLSKCLMPRT